MNVELQKKYKIMEKERSRKKKWRIAAISLCAVIAIGTSYILINPAATQVQETYCGFEEHVEHVDDCYEKVLVCQLPEEGHTHAETCYEEQQVLTCLLPETEGHTHSEDCYVTEEYLSCNKEETEGHQHGESCYAIERVLTCTSADEEHEHTEECYEDKAVLVCTLEECEAHQHDESCFSQRTVLTCTKEETPAHHHDTACYTTQTVCTCGMEESEPHQHTEACYAPDYEKLVCDKEIHQHTLQCFSNPEADLEDASVWERSFENVKLSGNLNEDIIAVAETQIGYAESTTNYQVQEDGVSVKGYTRYGAWYGDPYGDWCAMFCSFCLNYAGVDRTLVPQESGCTRWVEKLAALEMLRDPAAYTPKPGDIVFFDWESFDPEHPEDRQADHVGFVGELIVDEATNAVTKIKTIEGNWGDCVCSNVYDISNSTILGYAEIPENPENIITTIESQPACDGAVAVITGRLPENAEVIIQTIPLSEEELVEYFGEDMAITMTGYVAYDIKIMVDGVEWQPDNSVVVTVRQPELDLETPDDLSLAHVKDETKDVQDIEVQKDEESGISFETDGFSMYIVYTHTRNENRVDDETGVMVECNGTTLLVQELGDNEKLDELRVDSYQAFDIEVTNFTGEATVRIPLEEGYDTVWYLGEDENDTREPEIQEITIVEIDGVRYAEFTTNHFSDWGVGTSNVTYWQKVTAVGQITTTDVYMIVSKNGYALAADYSHNVLSGNNAKVTVAAVPGSNGIYTISGNGTYANFTWKFERAGGSAGEIVNVGTKSEIELDSNNVLASIGVDIYVNFAYDTYFHLHRDTIRGNRFLSESGGTFSRQDNAGTADMEIYKLVSAPTSTNGTTKSGSKNSTTMYTVNVYGVRVDSSGNNPSAPVLLGTVTVDSTKTSSSPVVPSTVFSGFVSSNASLKDATYKSAYYGTASEVDKENVTALYRYGTTGIRYLGLKYNGGNATEDKYLNASDPKALYIRYTLPEAPKDATVKTMPDGSNSSTVYTVNVYGIQVDSSGSPTPAGAAPVLLGTVDINSDVTNNHPVKPDELFADYEALSGYEYVSAYYGTASEVDKENVTALYRFRGNSGTRYLGLIYNSGNATEDRYLNASDPKALYIRYTAVSGGGGGDIVNPGFEVGSFEHNKYIDYLNDGGTNPDTNLKGEDFYRLYLDMTGRQEPVDLVIVVDGSGSMKTEDMTDENNNKYRRDTAITKFLNGATNASTSDGFLSYFLGLNPNNKVSVVQFYGQIGQSQDQGISKTVLRSGYKHGYDYDSRVLMDWKGINQFVNCGNVNNNGTNYEAGLLRATEQLSNAKVAGDGNAKMMIFLSDGVPTFFNIDESDIGTSLAGRNATASDVGYRGGSGIYNGTDGNVEINKAPAKRAFDEFLEANPGIIVFTVGVSKDINSTGGADESRSPEVLRYMAEKGGGSFIGVQSDTAELKMQLESIFYPADVTIEDELSKYVKYYGEQPDVKVTMTRKSDGVVTDLYSNGRSLNTSILTGVTYTPSRDGSSTGTVKAEFAENYKFDPAYNYTLSFNVKVTQEAYDEYAAAPLNYGGIKGDSGTDYDTNKTSSGKPGYYSNNEAKVTYNVSGAVKSEEYKMPVVQVSAADLIIEKNWSDGNENHADDPVTVDIYMKELPEDYDPTEAIPSSYRSNGTKLATFTLDEGNEWTDKLENVPKGYYYYIVEQDDTALTQYIKYYDPLAVAMPHGAGGSGSYSLEVDNKRVEKYLVLKKTDMSGSPLAGAQFKLYSDAQHTTEVYADSLIISTADGVFTPENFKIENGTYYLVETHAPDGYNLLTDDVVILVKDDGITANLGSTSLKVTSETSDDNSKKTYTFSVTNSSGYELPKTGGAGTTPYILCGLLLTAGAVYGYALRRKKERRSM